MQKRTTSSFFRKVPAFIAGSIAAAAIGVDICMPSLVMETTNSHLAKSSSYSATQPQGAPDA